MANVATLIKTNKLDQDIDWCHFWSQSMVDNFIKNENSKVEALGVLVDLMQAIQIGNSCIPLNSNYYDILDGLVSKRGDSTAPLIGIGGKLYLNRYYSVEVSLAQHIARLFSTYTAQMDLSSFDYLFEDEYQKNALKVVSNNALTIITGGPGTGKTYTLARIIAAMVNQFPSMKIALAAPTGKASQRMQEALHRAFSDKVLVDNGLITEALKELTPVTLHRLIGKSHVGKNLYNHNNKLPYDLIVVDEASMLDIALADNFLSAVRDGSKIILLGDPDQLASVDVGCFLHDLKTCNSLASSNAGLITSRRFSDGARIGSFARLIQDIKLNANPSFVMSELNSRVGAPSEFIEVSLSGIVKDFVQIVLLDEGVYSQSTLENLSLGFNNYFKRISDYQNSNYWDDKDVSEISDMFDEYRILTTKKNGFYGVSNLNTYMKNRLCEVLSISENSDWYLGRPVMITENNYKLGVSNGDVGLTLKHRYNTGEYEVYFPSSEKWINANLLPASITSAFAMTIHKSQGSEFEHVAVVLDNSAEKLLGKELVYTAITRAKKAVTVFAEQSSLVQGLTTKSVRNSGLVSKIDQMM